MTPIGISEYFTESGETALVVRRYSVTLLLVEVYNVAIARSRGTVCSVQISRDVSSPWSYSCHRA